MSENRSLNSLFARLDESKANRANEANREREKAAEEAEKERQKKKVEESAVEKYRVYDDDYEPEVMIPKGNPGAVQQPAKPKKEKKETKEQEMDEITDGNPFINTLFRRSSKTQDQNPTAAAFLMVSWCMALLAYCYKLAETIAMATFPIKHVMHVQNCTFISFAPTNLASVVIPIEYRLPQSCQLVAGTFLIICAFWCGFAFLDCFYKHRIERTNLNNCMRNRHYFAIHLDDIDVEFFLVFKRGRKPTIITFAVIKTCLTVAKSVSTGATHSTTTIVAVFLILQCIILYGHIFVKFAFYADADIVVTYILADFDGLSICFAVIQQLDGERVVLNDFCFSVFQESAYLAKTEGRH
jgi:hypothetical protein